MAVLEKIRVKMGAFITVLIGLALLSFIIDPATLETAVSMFSSKYDVGEMNGNSISYKDYQKKIDYYNQIYQITSGGTVSGDQTQEMINQSAWQDLIMSNVVLPTIEKAGIGVGKDELYDLAQGKNISPVLTADPAFLDENGNFDRARVAQLIMASSQDQSGNLNTYWNFIETNMYRDQMFTKYASLLEKSSIYNPVELAREIDNNNITSEVEFVMQPIGFAVDSTIQISQAEIKEYYEKHRNLYKRNASRDIEYVVFEVIPSQKDIDLAEEDMNKVFEGFKTSKNLKNYLTRYSDQPLNPYYFQKGELESFSPELEEFAFSAKQDDVLPVFKKGDNFMAARISDIKNMSDSAFVRHILLQGTDEKALEAKADSLIELLDKGADFSLLASEYSADQNNRVERNGDLGWMTQTYMIPGMEEVLYAQTDKNFKVKTNYGLHIVNVEKRTPAEKKVQLAVLTKEIVAGKETYQDFYAKANDLVSKAGSNTESFNAAAKEANLPVYPAMGIVDGAKEVATYSNARELSRWVYEAQLGEVSPIISIDNKYFFVATLTGIKEKGIAPMSEMETQISLLLMNRKKGEKIAEEIKAKIQGLSSMEEIAEKLGTTVSKQDAISFGAMGSQSFDPAMIGAVTAAPENQICGPIVGNVGVYVFNVLSRETGAFYTEDDAAMRRMQSAAFQLRMLPAILNDMADIQDNRARFF